MKSDGSIWVAIRLLFRDVSTAVRSAIYKSRTNHTVVSESADLFFPQVILIWALAIFLICGLARQYPPAAFSNSTTGTTLEDPPEYVPVPG